MLQLCCNKTTHRSSVLLRRSLAVVLLCAHAAAAVHLALGAHAVADSGAVVEAQPECAQETGHGSTGIAHGHQLSRDETECEAVALLRAVARTHATVLQVAAAAPTTPSAVGESHASPPLAVLSVAPKSSPPV